MLELIALEHTQISQFTFARNYEKILSVDWDGASGVFEDCRRK